MTDLTDRLLRHADLHADQPWADDEQMQFARDLRDAAALLVSKALTDTQKPVSWSDLCGAVARGWCHASNANKEMDVDLAFAIADEVQRLWGAAPQAQPAEPDMRHPKIQALISQNARQSIWMRLVEQLIEDPHFETSSMDMEYWDGTHDKIKEALTARAQPAQRMPLVQATAPREIWLQISDDERDNAETFPDGFDGITWSKDSATVCGVPYVRADLARAQPAPAQRLSDARILDLAEPFGAFEYGDAQGHKRIDFARAIEAELMPQWQPIETAPSDMDLMKRDELKPSDLGRPQYIRPGSDTVYPSRVPFSKDAT